MFNSYPAAVRARLGSLTREYKILRGTELIALGIKDCDAPQPGGPKIMVASASPGKPARAAGPDAQQPPAEAEKPEQAQRREHNVNVGHGAKKLRLPAIITGAQPILPPRFSAYAQLDR